MGLSATPYLQGHVTQQNFHTTIT